MSMCKGMTEADKEIIDILKELFRNKNNEFVDPDDLLLEQIVKWSIYLALLGLLILLPIKIFGNARICRKLIRRKCVIPIHPQC